jgi:hypothetical protein
LSQRLRLLGVRVGALEKTAEQDGLKENDPLAQINKAQDAIESIAHSDQLF